MTELERFLWNQEGVQRDLQDIIAAHSKRLLELTTPRGDAYNEDFSRRIMPILAHDVIDGKAVYDALIATGGGDLAVELYQKYRDLLTGNAGRPDLLDVADELNNMPPESPELIGGILRRGHNMMIAGGSKTSKSFLALELAVAVATGSDWLGTYPCSQGRVLYCNGEIDRPSCDRRIAAILERMKINHEDLRGKLSVVTLRGFEMTTGQLAEQINRSGVYDLVILDPLYVMGDVTDENNASDVLRFLKEIGRLSTETGAAVVCIHHHSKGQQGNKRSLDRASGSGVFGRWHDAYIDLSVLHAPAGVAEQSRTPESVPMRLEFELRDFKQPKPLAIWWHYPIHIPDASGDLDGLLLDGDPRANLTQYQQGQTEEQRQAQHDADMAMAIHAITSDSREPTIKAVADELRVSDRAVRKWLEKSSAIVKDGKILKTEHRNN